MVGAHLNVSHRLLATSMLVARQACAPRAHRGWTYRVRQDAPRVEAGSGSASRYVGLNRVWLSAHRPGPGDAVLSRWRRSIRERLRPGPEDTSDEEVRRSVERGSTPWRARALRVAAVRGIPLELPLVQTLLSDVGPGVRRATAWACGFSGEPVWVEPLAARLAAEPTRTVARELAIAAVRCGGSVAAFETALAGVLRRPVATWYGERDLSQAAGDAVGRQLKWYRAALGGGSDSARPFGSLRAERLSSIAADPDAKVTRTVRIPASTGRASGSSV